MSHIKKMAAKLMENLQAKDGASRPRSIGSIMTWRTPPLTSQDLIDPAGRLPAPRAIRA